MNIDLLLLLTLAAGCACESKRFDHYTVYRVLPTTLDHCDALHKLQENDAYTFLGDFARVNCNVDIMVPPHLKHNFEDYLKRFNVQGRVTIENVQTVIDNQRNDIVPRSDFNWQNYQDGDHINDWLRSLESTYPNIVKVVIGGQSHEGRDILGVHVSFKPGNKAVFLEGGIHGNEWISPATVTFILNELLTSEDSSVRAVAQSRDWYVFPSINPDGYAYTQVDRLWRKTRKPSENGCFGVDANRNWDYHWMDGGGSNAACSRNYAGTGPFSEIETKSLSEYISTIAPNLDAYIAFHCYSQFLLVPFGHNGLEVPENNEELLAIGDVAAKKLSERYGTQYIVGNIPQTIYVASGVSTDWVAGVHRNVRLVYTFELRDTGEYGSLLPPDQIIPTGEETLDAVVSMIQQIDNTL